MTSGTRVAPGMCFGAVYLVGGTEVGSDQMGSNVMKMSSQQDGGRAGGDTEGRILKNDCPVSKGSPDYREKQASLSAVVLNRNRKLQKTDYLGQKKNERSSRDLLDSLGQNDAQLHIK